MVQVQHRLGVSERRACRVVGQPRGTQRQIAHVADDEAGLTRRMVALASEYGRYGYRRVTALLRGEGGRVNHKRVARLWRREGLKVPRSSRSGVGYGWRTGRASGCGPRIGITSGRMTSSATARRRAAR